ncbi:hypothetical protein [Pseudomonas sp. AB12(2023)]|uniref:hypothetical protein n=1 Tax=Pseudomonas sp. AB12(2023) TaxID=3048597 RepID=UPI002B234CED|nr:hypothetical protein [Pseudomonas sp. AB12(2023)]MEB0221361.1 hypothetical protein [Pseudomonas sp. AB12(2023)]
MTNKNLEQLVTKTEIARNLAVAGLMIVIAAAILYAMWPSMVQRLHAGPIERPVYEVNSAEKAPPADPSMRAQQSNQ